MRKTLAFLALSLLPAIAAAQAPALTQLSRLAPDAEPPMRALGAPHMRRARAKDVKREETFYSNPLPGCICKQESFVSRIEVVR